MPTTTSSRILRAGGGSTWALRVSGFTKQHPGVGPSRDCKSGAIGSDQGPDLPHTLTSVAYNGLDTSLPPSSLPAGRLGREGGPRPLPSLLLVATTQGCAGEFLLLGGNHHLMRYREGQLGSEGGEKLLHHASCGRV